MASNRFLDRTITTGDLASTWHWTNGSTNVHSLAGNATTCCAGGTPLVAGDYIKAATKLEWYRIASVTDANTIVLAYAYREATIDPDTTAFVDVSVQDGSTVAKAFVHLAQYTETEARAAGDVLYCRRGQTHTHKAVNMTTDEAGTLASYIVVIADDGTNWAGEGGLADTIFDGADDTTFTWLFDNSYWRFEELKFTRVDSVNGVQFSGSSSRLINLTLDDNDGATAGCRITSTAAYASGCTFSNSAVGLNTATNFGIWVDKCTFDTNTLGFQSAISMLCTDCAFTNNTTDVTFSQTNIVQRFMSCALDLTKVTISSTSDPRGRAVPVAIFQDCGNAKDQNKAYYALGYCSRETAGFIRAGGADTSIKAIGYLALDDLPESPLVIYEAWIYSDGTSHTYTVYALADGGWAALPTSAQLWLEANYFDQAGDAGRANVKSNDAIAAEETWTPLDVTCDPAAAGMVQLRICLSKYQASKEIWVDPLIVVT